jgi:hypothetical protein
LHANLQKAAIRDSVQRHFQTSFSPRRPGGTVKTETG